MNRHTADRSENTGRHTALDVAAVACAGIAGLYIIMRGIWWGLIVLIGQ
jgi:hypothetical protein